jgi:hypothetical protein
MHDVLMRASHAAGIAISGVELPKDIEFCVRSNAERSVGILINHSNSAANATLSGSYRSLLPSIKLTSGGGQTSVELPAQGVAVLEKETTR